MTFYGLKIIAEISKSDKFREALSLFWVWGFVPTANVEWKQLAYVDGTNLTTQIQYCID